VDAPLPSLPPGTIVAARYQIVGPLGRGGMGVIYRGVELGGGREVAIKTAIGAGVVDDEQARRLEREAQAASFVQHPNVVEVIALDRLADGTIALVMELVAGQTLRDALAGGPLAPRRALVLTRQILDGVGHAHRTGVIHRDLKPENIMLTLVGRDGARYEQIKILDFGVVKLLGLAASVLGDDRLTRTGMIHGTPTYMAPEQALGRPVDGRADLYAIGAMLFELLVGLPPFDAPDAVALLRKHVSVPAPRLAVVAQGAPWVTAEVDALVATALAKKPTERFADAGAMIAALDRAFLSLDAR
jgi:serine/threonine-protein kinase